VRAEQLGVRNTKAGFDAISLGLVADGDTTARLGFNTNGHNGDGLAPQFGAKFLFDRGEIGVEIDKQPIDRRIDHLDPTSRSYCSWVSKRSTLPRPAMIACSTACLEARSRNPLPRRIISTMLSEFVKVRGSGLSAEILLHERAMPTLSKNEKTYGCGGVSEPVHVGLRTNRRFVRQAVARALRQDSARKSSRSFQPAASGLWRIVRRPCLTDGLFRYPSRPCRPGMERALQRLRRLSR
jgi:hypothetical protein